MTAAAPASPDSENPNHDATGDTAAPVASAAATASESAVTNVQVLRKTARAPSKSRRATRIVTSCVPRGREPEAGQHEPRGERDEHQPLSVQGRPPEMEEQRHARRSGPRRRRPGRTPVRRGRAAAVRGRSSPCGGCSVTSCGRRGGRSLRRLRRKEPSRPCLVALGRRRSIQSAGWCRPRRRGAGVPGRVPGPGIPHRVSSSVRAWAFSRRCWPPMNHPRYRPGDDRQGPATGTSSGCTRDRTGSAAPSSRWCRSPLSSRGSVPSP